MNGLGPEELVVVVLVVLVVLLPAAVVVAVVVLSQRRSSGPAGGPDGRSGAAQTEHPLSVTSLVLGVLGLSGLGLLAPLAWVLARRGLREVTAAPGRYRPGALLRAARLLGIVGTTLLGLFLVAVVVALVLR